MTEKGGFGGGWEVWLPKSQPPKSQTTSDSSQEPHNDAGLRLVDTPEESTSRETDSSADSTRPEDVLECPVCGIEKAARVIAGVTYLKCGHLFVAGSVS